MESILLSHRSNIDERVEHVVPVDHSDLLTTQRERVWCGRCLAGPEINRDPPYAGSNELIDRPAAWRAGGGSCWLKRSREVRWLATSVLMLVGCRYVCLP